MSGLIGFVLRLAALLVVAAFLVEQPGHASIVWRGYVIESSAAFLALAFLALVFVLFALFRFWHGLRHGWALRGMRRKLRILQEGQNALTQGLAALAGGDAAGAGRLAATARKKLGTSTATLLLQAQAAQLAHDHRAARDIFLAMIDDADSAMLGYRGLTMAARRAGDWDEVERLCGEIGRLDQDRPWLHWIRFEAAARRAAWEDAGEALERLAPSRLLEASALRRHRAALYIARSQEEARQGSVPAALEYAERAAKETPDWLPALINLAARQAAGGFARAARRTVEKAWAIQPHPQLAEIVAAEGDDPMASYRQVERLCAGGESDPASRLSLAKAALQADIWGEARRNLMAMVTLNRATQEAFRLLARLERRESGDEKAALQWLTKSAEAAADPVWLCSACGGAQEKEWQAACKSCGAFATLEWRSPGVSRIGTKTPQPLLPQWEE